MPELSSGRERLKDTGVEGIDLTLPDPDPEPIAEPEPEIASDEKAIVEQLDALNVGAEKTLGNED